MFPDRSDVLLVSSFTLLDQLNAYLMNIIPVLMVIDSYQYNI